MSSAVLAGAVALNLAGSYMPGTLPPEPSAKAHPHAHAAWANIPNLKIIKPQLERHEGVFHGPAILTEAPARNAENQVYLYASSNWSGGATTISPQRGTYSTAVLFMSVLVPNVRASFGSTCDNNVRRYTSVWNGVDGFDSNPATVEQAGINIISDCVDRATIGAWIESYPNPENAISNFPISTGDLVDIWTWVAPGVTCGAWEDETKQSFTQACINDPYPNAVAYQNLEWIVERPVVGGKSSALGNYFAIPIWSAFSYSYQTGQVFGSAAADPSFWGAQGSLYLIDMKDDNGGIISRPAAYYVDMMTMYDAGSAYCQAGANCEPRAGQ